MGKIMSFSENSITWKSPTGDKPIALQQTFGPHTTHDSDIIVPNGTWADVAWNPVPKIPNRTPLSFSSPTSIKISNGIYVIILRITFKDSSAAGFYANVGTRVYDMNGSTVVSERATFVGAFSSGDHYDFPFNSNFLIKGPTEIKVQVTANKTGYVIPSGNVNFMSEIRLAKEGN